MLGVWCGVVGVGMGVGVGGERHTHEWGTDRFETRSLNHVLSLNSSFRLADFLNEIKVDNSVIPI